MIWLAMSNIYSTQLLPTAATHKSTLTSYLDKLWNAASEKLTSVASYSFPSVARSMVIGALEGLQFGELRVITPEKEVLTFGRTDQDSSVALKAELRINRPSFWTRVLLSADLGFGEAYMYGDVDCDDIPAFLKLMILNSQQVKAQLASTGSSFLSKASLLTAARFLGDLSTTRANISAHYDIDNTMFAAFLSPDMNYSSAIFKDFEEDIRHDMSGKRLETLEEGQIRKMRNLIYRARIQENHRLLEIGTGWGSFAILAVQLTGCTVETITLSSEQKTLAEARIGAVGLSDKITVHLMDYREIKHFPRWKHYFDRFISVEMMEHVGKEFFEAYWEVVDWALKEDDAVGCVQVITLPEANVEQYDKKVDFIRKWSMSFNAFENPLINVEHIVFPGGYLPSLTHLISTMTSGTKGRLTTDSVWNIGPHYARTLREWKRNFLRNFEDVISPRLRARYNLSDSDLEIFRRKWRYYFECCEAGFATRTLGDHIISFTREGNMALGCTWDDYGKVDVFSFKSTRIDS